MRKGTIEDFSKKLNFWHIMLTAIPMCAEYNGASYSYIDHKWSYDHFYALAWVDKFVFRISNFAQIHTNFNLYVSEQMYVPVTKVYIFQLYKSSIVYQ